MITRWDSGRESELLDHIIAGRKTIEGRLNRSKFAQSAADMYNRYYSAADQARYGVLAIEITVVEL